MPILCDFVGFYISVSAGITEQFAEICTLLYLI